MTSQISSDSSTNNRTIENRKVRKITWNGKTEDDVHFAKIVSQLAKGKPLVVTQSPASRWNVMRWDPSYMESRVSDRLVLPVKRRSDGAKFNLGCCVPQRVIAKSFFRMISYVSKNDEYAYFAGPLDYLGTNLSRDVDMRVFDTMEVSSTSKYCTDSVEGASSTCLQSTVWIGSGGAITPCHHDELHNFFLQVKGRKRFTLLPPNTWDKLRLFPKYHQLHRNVRTNIDDDASILRDEGVQFVELSEGDVLYLPPLWFHQVEALTAVSISVNVWSASGWIRDVTRMWDLDVPVEFHPSNIGTLVAMLGLYVHRILEVVKGDRARAKAFLQSLLVSRYDSRKSVQSRSSSSSTPKDDDDDERKMDDASAEHALHEEYLRRVERESPSFVGQAGTDAVDVDRLFQERCPHKTRISRDIELRFDRAARAVRDVLSSARARASLDDGETPRWIRGAEDIFLAHYLEDVSSQAVGFSHVRSFFEMCVAAGAEPEGVFGKKEL